MTLLKRYIEAVGSMVLFLIFIIVVLAVAGGIVWAYVNIGQHLLNVAIPEQQWLRIALDVVGLILLTASWMAAFSLADND